MEVTPHYKVREGGETMKALAWFGKKDVKVIDAPIPDITQPDDVIVRVTGTTICGEPNSPSVTFCRLLIITQVRISTCTTARSSLSRRVTSLVTNSWAPSTGSDHPSNPFILVNASWYPSKSPAANARTANKNSARCATKRTPPRCRNTCTVAAMRDSLATLTLLADLPVGRPST